MGHFVTDLDAKIGSLKVDGKWTRVARLDAELIYDSPEFGLAQIPYGFESDGASVPKILWNLYPPFGEYLEAAIIHDWFCVLGHAGTSPIGSQDAARLFLEVMEVMGVGKWKRIKMYWAVRIAGPHFKASKEAHKSLKEHLTDI
jgi:hypothetical protein